MIRLITLDVNNTLLRFSTPPVITYSRAAAKFGIAASPAELSGAFKLAVKQQKASYPVFGSGSIGWQEWWRGVVRISFQHCGVSNEDHLQQTVAKIARYLLYYYSTAASYTVLPHAVDLIEELATREVTVGVISNSDPRIKKVLSEHGFDKHIMFVTDAYTAGFTKPHPAIFKEAIIKAGIPNLSPSEVLHIGDSLIDDYLGARSVGWKSWLVAEDFREQCALHRVEVAPENMFENLYQLLPFVSSALISP